MHARTMLSTNGASVCSLELSSTTLSKMQNQLALTETIQARRLTLFGHIARMDDDIDAKQILTSSPPVD